MTDISVEFHYFSLVTLFLLASVKNVQQKISYSLRVLAEVNQWQIQITGFFNSFMMEVPIKELNGVTVKTLLL